MITYNNSVLKVGSSWLHSELDPNPLNLPPFTIRLRLRDWFTSPSFPKGTAVQVSSGTGANIWDLTYEDGDWSNLLGGVIPAAIEEVLGANTSGVYDMSHLFHYGANITSVQLFDTSSVQNMEGMFASAESLTTIPAFDTSNVTNMSWMFAACQKLTSLPLLNTSNVTNMSCLFCHNDLYDNHYLTTIPPWDMSSVTIADRMFSFCTALTNVPLLDLSSVVNMRQMFEGCSSLATVPTFDTSSATNMKQMFNRCSSLTAVPLFDTADVTDVASMFSYCYNVQSGSLALYTQLSSQTIPPTNYSNCFTDCGRDTVSGAAELAQIPSSWGGTGA